MNLFKPSLSITFHFFLSVLILSPLLASPPSIGSYPHDALDEKQDSNLCLKPYSLFSFERLLHEDKPSKNFFNAFLDSDTEALSVNQIPSSQCSVHKGTFFPSPLQEPIKEPMTEKKSQLARCLDEDENENEFFKTIYNTFLAENFELSPIRNDSDASCSYSASTFSFSSSQSDSIKGPQAQKKSDFDGHAHEISTLHPTHKPCHSTTIHPPCPYFFFPPPDLNLMALRKKNILSLPLTKERFFNFLRSALKIMDTEKYHAANIFLKNFLRRTMLTRKQLSIMINVPLQDINGILFNNQKIDAYFADQLKKNFQITYDPYTNDYTYPLEEKTFEHDCIHENLFYQTYGHQNHLNTPSSVLFKSLLIKTWLNQIDLSLLLNIPESTIHLIVKGEKNIDLTIATSLKKYFNIFYDPDTQAYHYSHPEEGSRQEDQMLSDHFDEKCVITHPYYTASMILFQSLLIKKKINKTELSQALKISIDDIQHIFNGEKIINKKMAARIKSKFDIDYNSKKNSYQYCFSSETMQQDILLTRYTLKEELKSRFQNQLNFIFFEILLMKRRLGPYKFKKILKKDPHIQFIYNILKQKKTVESIIAMRIKKHFYTKK